MKNLINLQSNKNIKGVYAHINYHISENCKNPETYIICYKCGKCGRKFNKSGIKISSN